jgi:hypothetical protein
MLRLLLSQQFPSCTVETVPDPHNSGNFVVEALPAGAAAPHVVLSPYGFLTPAARMRELLLRVRELPDSATAAAGVAAHLK